MKRLRMLVVGLCIIQAVLCGVAVATGRSQPDNPDLREALGLTMCGGDVCFLGFVPNVTPWSKFRDSVLQYPELYDQGDCISFRFSRYIRSLTVCAAHGDPTRFGSVFFGPDLSGDSFLAISLITKYGPPCAVDTSRMDLRLLYRFFSIDTMAHERLELSSEVTQIELYDRTVLGSYNPCLHFTSEIKPWRGFTQYRTFEP